MPDLVTSPGYLQIQLFLQAKPRVADLQRSKLDVDSAFQKPNCGRANLDWILWIAARERNDSRAGKKQATIRLLDYKRETERISIGSVEQ
jgi:hypothetical protein